MNGVETRSASKGISSQNSTPAEATITINITKNNAPEGQNIFFVCVPSALKPTPQSSMAAPVESSLFVRAIHVVFFFITPEAPKWCGCDGMHYILYISTCWELDSCVAFVTALFSSEFTTVLPAPSPFFFSFLSSLLPPPSFRPLPPSFLPPSSSLLLLLLLLTHHHRRFSSCRCSATWLRGSAQRT